MSNLSGGEEDAPGADITPDKGVVARLVPGSDPLLLKGALTDQAMSGVEDEELFTTGARWNLRLRTHRRPRRFDA